ncbi:MAG TPA: hypothetical protein VHN74_13430 [Candidatus Angelobacter sp.]|nr:hypothetical protein [Candidatus Angelobacter sp.]
MPRPVGSGIPAASTFIIDVRGSAQCAGKTAKYAVKMIKCGPILG